MRYVIRDGKLVQKGTVDPCPYWRSRSDFPAPMLSRMEPFESPVTGKEISSWRDRDRDMEAAGAVDPRDLAPPSRGRAARRKEAEHGRGQNDTAFEWGRLPDPV